MARCLSQRVVFMTYARVFILSAAAAFLASSTVLAQSSDGEKPSNTDGSAPRAETMTGSGGGPVSTPLTRPTRLKKQAFPKDGFSVMLPIAPSKKIKSSDTVIYECNEFPHGNYAIEVKTYPAHTTASPMQLERGLGGFLEERKKTAAEAVMKKKAITVNDSQGWEIEITAPNELTTCRGKAFVAGRRSYIVTASGTRPWLECAHVKKFFDSVEVKAE